MNYEEAKSLADIKPGTFSTPLCNEVHQNLLKQMDIFMGIHWLDILLQKYPRPVPDNEGCAFGFSMDKDGAVQGVYGINESNAKERVDNGLNWATPMIITAIISETEYLLSSIVELHKQKTSKENWYSTASKFFNSASIWQNAEISRFRESFLACMDILSNLNSKRNGIVHRRTRDGHKRSFQLTITDIGNLWLHAIYTVVVVDGLLDQGIVNETPASA